MLCLSSTFYSPNSSSSKFSKFSASLAKLNYAYLYNLTNLINLTILTILPAFVPTREALPALANWAADLPYDELEEENNG